MPLLSCLSRTWSHIQGNLFPWLTEELGPLTEAHKRVVMTLELAGVEAFVQVWPGLAGRPPHHRDADGAARGGQAIAPAVRLGTPRRASQRGNLLARLRGVCGERVAGSPARGADQADP